MRIRISDPVLLGDLADFLRRAECLVEEATGSELEVEVPRALNASHARRELSIYLATWQARHPGVDAQLSD